ncbi:MAG TPA: hypothetical protein VIM06_06500, partial [Rhodanobacter sp.]
PLQRAPIMPLANDGETSPGRHETVSAAPLAATVAPMRPSHAPVATDTTRVAPVALEPPEPALMPTRAAASTPRDTVQLPASTAVPAPSSIVERSAVSPASAEVLAPPPVQPRQTRITVEQPEPAALSHPANGALLPASTPVFGTARVADAPGRSNQAAAMRTLAAPTGPSNSSSEPVVHVSIGRLEVRAAPASVTPPRRRDGPQPSSLDDYLRQRGKASP